MRHAFAFAALLTASCGAGAAELPVQEPEQVVALLTAAVRGCTAPLAASGSIDEAGLARAGWSRSRGGAPGSPGEAPETTTWARGGAGNELHLTRYGASGGSLHDECMIDARVADRQAVERVLSAMRTFFARSPDRQGEQPRGGDFLTPRSDGASFAYHWALPSHDAYLSRQDGGYIRLVVVAMADRTSLDRYSPDRPEARIPTAERPQ